MRRAPILVMVVAALLIAPAAMAAMVAPFGLDPRVPLPKWLFSIVLILSPIMALIAGFGGLFALQNGRRVSPVAWCALAIAAAANALFWSGV